MMGVQLKICGHIIFNRPFNLIDGFARRNASAVSHSKNMRVHRLCGLLPPHIQHDICSFASNPRQALQGSARIGHLAAEVCHQNLRHLDHVASFGFVKPDGLDMGDQPLFAKIDHLLRRIHNFKQSLSGFVNALVSRLRRKRHGHHERIGIHMMKLPLWFRFAVFKPRENFAHYRIWKLFRHDSSI